MHGAGGATRCLGAWGGGVSAVRAWSGGPPASTTGDILYMIEPSAQDWTHMTALGRRGWIQIVNFFIFFLFGMNYSGMGVPALPPSALPPRCVLTALRYSIQTVRVTDRDWAF